MNNALIKYLKNVIRNISGLETYFIKADKQAKYPYIVYDFKELPTEDIDKRTIELTVDAWDWQQIAEVIKAIDLLDKAFKAYKDMTDDFLIQIYHGSVRQFVDDEDKEIKRLQRKYDIVIYERSE